MNTSFSLSLELVLLIDWLLKHEKKEIKKLIEKALKNGFLNEIQLIDSFTEEELFHMDQQTSNNLNDSVFDFLMFLEDVLLDNIESKNVNQPLQENFSGAIQKLNNQKIDSNTIWLSVQQANNKITGNKKIISNNTPKRTIIKKNIKNVLFSQLLKNWVPKTNDPVN